MPVCGANKIPHNACLPATSFRPGSRSNGSMGDTLRPTRSTAATDVCPRPDQRADKPMVT
ncbi:hypothetical protein Sros01_35480 [Streptomyces roseochromogenus]|nr:hypothetical protein Sros01_35480 [Streptomyces roseochromogenus]